MRIIQITDLHINHNDDLVNNVDTRKNFVKVLDEATALNPDLMVFTGDLCYQRSNPKIYEWIKSKLTERNISNYYVIPGNHDNSIELAHSFDLDHCIHGEELYYIRYPNMLFLDTSPGYCSIGQWNWLEEMLKNISMENLFVFMHHPPFKAGVPHMDEKYAFSQSEIFRNIFSDYKGKIFVFCGHYHNEITMKIDNFDVFVSPSTYLQISPKTIDFTIDHTIPAYRIIDIDNQILKTSVKYVFDK